MLAKVHVSFATFTKWHTFIRTEQEPLCCRHLVSHKPLHLFRGQDPTMALWSPS